MVQLKLSSKRHEASIIEIRQLLHNMNEANTMKPNTTTNTNTNNVVNTMLENPPTHVDSLKRKTIEKGKDILMVVSDSEEDNDLSQSTMNPPDFRSARVPHLHKPIMPPSWTEPHQLTNDKVKETLRQPIPSSQYRRTYNEMVKDNLFLFF